MTRDEFAGMIDHTLLKPAVTYGQLETVCLEAVTFGFATVAIQPAVVGFAHRVLAGSRVGITTGISYSQGNTSLPMKLKEIDIALADGATDCDVVINLGALYEGNYSLLKEEAQECRRATEGHIAKAILEVCLLSEQQIRVACEIFADSGFDYVKSSTGYRVAPTFEQIKLMADSVAGSGTKVKAAGGISTVEQAIAFIEVGVSRIGTSRGTTLIGEFLAC